MIDEPEVVSYGSTNATLSYITDCTHTDGPISRIEILNTGDNYNILPGFTTVTSVDGNNAVFRIAEFRYWKDKKY